MLKRIIAITAACALAFAMTVYGQVGLGGDPASNLTEMGVTELVGINEALAASQYSASVSVTLAGPGEIVKVCMIATEDDAGGGGVVFTPSGDLMLFDADPAISADDATITNAERLTLAAIFTFTSANYQSDANGAANCQATSEVFHGSTLFATWHSATGETSWNSGAGDDEQLEFNMWFKRGSN